MTQSGWVCYTFTQEVRDAVGPLTQYKHYLPTSYYMISLSIYIALNNNYMTTEIKIQGMIHIPGVNDEAYATYINSSSSIESNNLWFTLP